jgi:hypothetical protein
LRGKARERCVLRVGDQRHQAQVLIDRVSIAELAQALRTRREQCGPIGQPDPRHRALCERLDLTGLENALHGMAVVCLIDGV